MTWLLVVLLMERSAFVGFTGSLMVTLITVCITLYL